LAEFCAAHAAWLGDYAHFCALQEFTKGAAWTDWDQDIRARRSIALKRSRAELAQEIDYQNFLQYQFYRQWSALKAYCAERGVGLIGDIPIFVAHDSADVWAHQELFQLQKTGRPRVVAGIPPDYFSKDGQLWGNPLYAWDAHRGEGYAWWQGRLGASFERFDAVRLDHFIGFHRCWEVDAAAKTARKGNWVLGPGAEFFAAVRRGMGKLELIAEDLGVLIPEVKQLRDGAGLPGMRVLQFAFGNDPEAENYQPHRFPRECVVYTGTHDNDTTVGWFNDRGSSSSTRSRQEIEAERAFTLRYLASDGREIHWDMIRAALLSVAHTALFPMQDVLGHGSEARMNMPGTSTGNWGWRLAPGALDAKVAERLRVLTETYGRNPRAPYGRRP
jgi:4-alpha-glucanotransferase